MIDYGTLCDEVIELLESKGLNLDQIGSFTEILVEKISLMEKESQND